MSRSPVVLYIGGFGRSGSTLLETLLGSAPDVTSLGEVVHLWRRGLAGDELCGCGRPFSRCPFWTEVGDRAFGGWQHVDVDRVLALQRAVDRQRLTPLLLAPRLPAGLGSRVAEYVACYQRLYAAAAEVGGTTAVVDSSKHPSLAALLRTDSALDLRVVHLVRDSRAVAHSWTRQVRRPEVDGEVFMPRHSTLGSSGYWLGQNGLFHLIAARAVPTLRVRYEDLAGDPAAVLASVRTFTGLPGSVRGSAAQPAPEQHSVAGNPLRFRAGPLTVRRDEAWREAMPTRDRRLVSVLTAPLALRYGYLGRRPR